MTSRTQDETAPKSVGSSPDAEGRTSHVVEIRFHGNHYGRTPADHGTRDARRRPTAARGTAVPARPGAGGRRVRRSPGSAPEADDMEVTTTVGSEDCGRLIAAEDG